MWLLREEDCKKQKALLVLWKKNSMGGAAMKKKVSIKTVDGNRYDFVCSDDNIPEVVGDIGSEWLRIYGDNETRLFPINNIVLITIKGEDDA